MKFGILNLLLVFALLAVSISFYLEKTNGTTKALKRQADAEWVASLDARCHQTITIIEASGLSKDSVSSLPNLEFELLHTLLLIHAKSETIRRHNRIDGENERQPEILAARILAYLNIDDFSDFHALAIIHFGGEDALADYGGLKSMEAFVNCAVDEQNKKTD